MIKKPTYEDLQKRIEQLEKELNEKSSLSAQTTYNIHYQRFFEICELAKNAIAVLETKDNGNTFYVKYVNKSAETIEKVSRDKILEKSLEENFPVIKRSGFLEVLRRVLKSGISEEFVSKAYIGQHLINWNQNQIFRLSENQLAIIYTDETIQHKREFELHESREKLKLAMDAANYYSFEINLENQKIYTDPAVYESLSYTNNEINDLMKSTGSLIHPEEFGSIKKYITKLPKNEKIEFNYEFRIKDKKDHWVWFKSSGRNIEWDSEGNPLKIVGLIRNIQAEKEKEQQLKENEARLNLALRSAKQGLIDWNVQTNEIYFSPEWAKMLEYEPSEIEYNYDFLVKIGHPDDMPQSALNLVAHLSGEKEIFESEVRVKTKSGNWKWILTHGKIVEWDEKGNPLRGLAIQTDISSLKDTENKLKESQEKYKDLVTLLPEIVYECDVNGRVTFVNQRALEIFEYTQEEFEKGLNVMQVIIPEEIPKAIENIQLLLTGKGRKSEEYTCITKSGKTFPAIIYSTAIKQNNEYTGHRGIMVDISEQKNTINALRTSEEKFMQLANNISDAFWLRTLDYKVLYANPACYLTIGKNFNEVFENTDIYKEWIHPDDRERVINQLIKNKNEPDKEHFYEHRIIDSNNVVRWLWIRTFPVYNEKGVVYRRAGIASDITHHRQLLSELIEARNKAEESDRLKSAFLANMSHEIRTPMNGILGFTELLRDSHINPVEKENYIKVIHTNGLQLLNLINDIVDIAKIEANQLLITKINVPINSLLFDIYNLFIEEQKRLHKTEISFTFETPSNSERVEIFTDRFRLQQILSNLLSNAFKFTKSGEIRFGYSIVENNGISQFLFFVKDTGIGIAENMQEIIFERFRMIENKNYKNKQGTGLGLAISKGLLELLGGKIWVTSDPHSGSSFYFTVPVSNTTHENQSENNFKAASKMDRLKKTKILVVEDDADNLEFLKRLLQMKGTQVVTAISGEDAIEIIQKDQNIELVLMDILLPEMSGYEATRRIKEINPNLPVIAQTAYAMQNDREKCLEYGCDDYISKPINKDLLFKKILNFL
jgi:PAS domain S-box-containing protein